MLSATRCELSVVDVDVDDMESRNQLHQHYTDEADGDSQMVDADLGKSFFCVCFVATSL